MENGVIWFVRQGRVEGEEGGNDMRSRMMRKRVRVVVTATLLGTMGLVVATAVPAGAGYRPPASLVACNGQYSSGTTHQKAGDEPQSQVDTSEGTPPPGSDNFFACS